MVKPEAVVRGRNGYLRVLYHKLGLQFQTYEQWISSGARVPSTSTASTSFVARNSLGAPAR